MRYTYEEFSHIVQSLVKYIMNDLNIDMTNDSIQWHPYTEDSTHAKWGFTLDGKTYSFGFNFETMVVEDL